MGCCILLSHHLLCHINIRRVNEHHAEGADLFGHNEGILRTPLPHSMATTMFTVRQKNTVSSGAQTFWKPQMV